MRKHSQTAILTDGSLLAQNRLRLFVVLPVLVIVVLLIIAPKSYKVWQGQLTYQLEPTLSGGNVNFPLGPFGVVKFKTAKGVANLRADYVLDKEPTDGQDPTQMLEQMIKNGVQPLKSDAWGAFWKFLGAKIPLLLAFGVLVGALLDTLGVHQLRQTMLNAFVGFLVMLMFVSVTAGMTWATLKRVPSAEYAGPTYIPAVWEWVRQVIGNEPVASVDAESLVRGVKAVTYRNRHLRSYPPQNQTMQLLAASDFHDNILGMKRANGIFHQHKWHSDQMEWSFKAVLLAGDLTNKGSQVEADLFAGMLKVGNAPIYMVDGNHENAPAMKEFPKLGYTDISYKIVSVGSLKILGFDDPLAGVPAVDPPNAQLLPDSSKKTAAFWSGLSTKPQVVMVHELAQASGIIELAKKDNQHLTVIYGHNHKPSVKFDGTVCLVDCGTAGAPSLDILGKGEEPNSSYDYQILDFSEGNNPQLLSVTTLIYDGLNSNPTMLYTPVNN